jgi:hypothetical protein
LASGDMSRIAETLCLLILLSFVDYPLFFLSSGCIFTTWGNYRKANFKVVDGILFCRRTILKLSYKAN